MGAGLREVTTAGTPANTLILVREHRNKGEQERIIGAFGLFVFFLVSVSFTRTALFLRRREYVSIKEYYYYYQC
jgi:hypothetical protein